MTRTALLCVTLGAILLLPALCLGGVLEHACACEDEQTACQHEDECPGDPCSVTLFVAGKTDPGSSSHGPLAASQPAWSFTDLDLGRSVAPDALALLEVARKLPYPSSDLPLRI